MAERSDGDYFQLYVIMRCSRWGEYVRWKDSVGLPDPKPKHVRSSYGLLLNGNVQQLEPTNRDVCRVDIAEAIETGICIDRLPAHLKETVESEYSKVGTRVQKAAALGIETRTFRYRLTSAHALLLGLFNDAAAGCLE
jgi:hypothetical protein